MMMQLAQLFPLEKRGPYVHAPDPALEIAPELAPTAQSE